MDPNEKKIFVQSRQSVFVSEAQALPHYHKTALTTDLAFCKNKNHESIKLGTWNGLVKLHSNFLFLQFMKKFLLLKSTPQ